jgi:hypothetical protein
MSNMMHAKVSRPFRAKHITFVFIFLMMAYVVFHNERFLIDPSNPVWQHYKGFPWWLLLHGVAGVCALFLAPLQFSDRLRRRFALLHRVVGRIYVAGVFVLGPIGVYIQYLDEGLGGSRSFTIATLIDATLLLVTTGIGLVFALVRMIPQHRQWMIRSYAVGLIFFEARFVVGLAGLDQPPDLMSAEITVWTCVALSVLIGDLSNQWYDLPPMQRLVLPGRSRGRPATIQNAARPG